MVTTTLANEYGVRTPVVGCFAWGEPAAKDQEQPRGGEKGGKEGTVARTPWPSCSLHERAPRVQHPDVLCCVLRIAPHAVKLVCKGWLAAARDVLADSLLLLSCRGRGLLARGHCTFIYD